MNLKFWQKPDSKPKNAMRWCFIGLDIIFIMIVVVQIAGLESPILQTLEIFLASCFLSEWLLRLKKSDSKKTFFTDYNNWLDGVVLLAVAVKYLLLASVWLQLLTGLRIFRAYRLLRELAIQSPSVSFYSETIRAFLNLFIFIILVSEIVFLWLGPQGIGVESYIDALYFTITTLTTTGYGDITVQSSSDKVLVIFIMVFGAALFLKLASQLFRSQKIYTECKRCGLQRHDPDASHCKHCGKVVRIQTDGED